MISQPQGALPFLPCYYKKLETMEIEPIAFFRSPFATKFGIPKQSGLADTLRGTIEFVPKYRNADALRGMEDFDYLWLVWEFSANKHEATSPVVRPPRLGGNTKVGVFATRSPFRPNRLGLSSVRIDRIDYDAADGPLIHVLGADLMNGTPIYDIKPYVSTLSSPIVWLQSSQPKSLRRSRKCSRSTLVRSITTTPQRCTAWSSRAAMCAFVSRTIGLRLWRLGRAS